MRLEDGHIVPEERIDGVVAADACKNGSAEIYRYIEQDRLPIIIGDLATKRVIGGLRSVAENTVSDQGYLTSALAGGYLVYLGIIETK